MSGAVSSGAKGGRRGLRRWLPATWRDWRGPLVRCGWLIVVAAYTGLAYAYVFPHDLRNTGAVHVWAAWTAFMIRTFLFHLGLLLCAVAIGAAVLRRWRLVIAAVPAAAFTVGPAAWSCLPKRPPAVAGETIRIMSANLLAENRRTGPIVAEVAAVRPDVLVLLEYAPHWHQAFQVALGSEYPYVCHVQRWDSFGLAIYSRRPFVEPVKTALALGGAGTPQARAVIELAGRAVALYVVHLMPPIGRAYTAEQRAEFVDLLELLREEKLPVVLCGDFNFTNESVFADELERLGLADAHRISGWGRGATWPALGLVRYVPGVRIDHVFLSQELTSRRSTVGRGGGSDHRPIVVEVGFAR